MEAFLHNLFGAALSSERQLAVFTMPDVRTQHFTSIEAAVLHARRECPSKDVYFGVGLAGSNFNERSCSDDIVAIPGLWVDLDCVGPKREDKPLPRDPDEARVLVDGLPLPPSLLVHSGYGLHAYWLFKEPWLFDSKDERDQARKLSKGWHGLVCARSRALGWTLENLGDLARVLRLPGSLNHKGKQPVEVRILEEHLERRYDPSDFEDFICVESPAVEPVISGELALRLDAEPPAEKSAMLLSSCPAFAQGWQRQRVDLQDQSQSAYDLSLADIAALNGWSDQEIANLVIASRRKHGDKPEKALRPDYLARTITAARQAAQERCGAGVDLSGLLPLANADPPSLRQLRQSFPELRPPVIEGLLREGETMNVISAPKIGKSWLVNDLGIAIAIGGDWLGFPCVLGDVLIVDNELHCETSAHRIPKVAAARGVPLERIQDRIYVENLRGRLKDLTSLGSYFRQFQPGRFKLVILDAFYRFLPMRMDENDNGTMANLYDCIDGYANYLQCSFVLIHHTSKGNQSLKEVTDVGAGAGAQARATDTHVILRRHEQDDVVVMEAAVRSWQPVKPRCLRWAFPVWLPADELDPCDLRPEAGKQRKAEKADSGDPEPVWTPESFVEAFVAAEARAKTSILTKANEQGLSDRKASRLLEQAEDAGLIYRWKLDRGRIGYAREPRPEAVEEDDTPKRLLVEQLLHAEPKLSVEEVAERCDVSDRYVRKIRAQLGGSDDLG